MTPVKAIRVRVGLIKKNKNRTVVVAQLVKWSLPIPEVNSSNPDIGKIYNENLFIVVCVEKMTKIKKKRPEMVHF